MIQDMEKKVRWPNFAKHFSELLEKTGVTLYEIDENTELRSPNLSKIKSGTERATDRTLVILASYKPLEINLLELLKWRMSDEHPEGVMLIEEALLEILRRESPLSVIEQEYEKAKKRRGK